MTEKGAAALAKRGAPNVSRNRLSHRTTTMTKIHQPQRKFHPEYPAGEFSADFISSTSFKWRRDGNGWRLFAGRRKFGRVVPDRKHHGMWRSVLLTGRLSDMASLSWARNAVLEMAIREVEYEVKTQAATGMHPIGWTQVRPLD
jgi:hypothetical protein